MIAPGAFHIRNKGRNAAVEFIQVLQAYVDMRAVLIAVILSQSLKYFLPSPAQVTEGGMTTTDIPKSFMIESGKWWTRLMPFFPVLIGMVSCYFIDRVSPYTFAAAVRGFLSGALAAYLYRTTKVTVFGD